MTEPRAPEGLLWESVPGPFELLEADDLREDDPRLVEIATPVVTRALVPPSPAEQCIWWQALPSRLRGFRRDRVLLDSEPVWVSILDLYAPPAGTAALRYECRAGRDKGAALKILGLGYGEL